MTLQDKIEASIALLRKSEPLALELNENGFYLAFSGGKDSLCLYHVAKMAGVKFEAHYNVTTLDPPELVYFIRDHYPDVKFDYPKMNFWQLCKKKSMLPTRKVRFCCAELKETNGVGKVVLIGIRHAESTKRSKRNEAEITRHKFSGTFDQFVQHRDAEHVCIKGKDKLVISPIIEWTEQDVWDFIKGQGLEYCKLYDEGWKRIGCLFCPMASRKSHEEQEKRYPKYADKLLRIIHDIRAIRWMSEYPDLTDEELYQWYISGQPIKVFYHNLKRQQKLDI